MFVDCSARNFVLGFYVFFKNFIFLEISLHFTKVLVCDMFEMKTELVLYHTLIVLPV